MTFCTGRTTWDGISNKPEVEAGFKLGPLAWEMAKLPTEPPPPLDLLPISQLTILSINIKRSTDYRRTEKTVQAL